ncbi:MAG TPA: hypothetical protein IGS40_01790, partial [Trichormus sp. M33_DOE_039]|nr:hypothetical protein [Trichormus sp. M33_DOE_039]
MTDNLATTSGDYPELGIKKPLLPHKPLGQKLLSPKFLSPLGAKSLLNFDSSVYFSSDFTDYTVSNNLLNDSPLLSESQSQHFKQSDLNLQTSSNNHESVNIIHSNKLDNHQSVPSPQAISSTTPQNSAPQTTVIQPQIGNHQSVSSSQAISSTTPQNSAPQTTVIQPQLDNHQSVPSPQAISSTTPQNSAS